MHVFIDTTEFFHSPRLTGAKWAKLGRFFRQSTHIGCVTQIVVDELVNHVRERLEKINGSLDSHNAVVQNNLGSDCGISYSKIEIDKQVQSYRQDLLKRLEHLLVRVVPCNAVSLDKLVKRSLNRRKPFDGEGHRGFRDAIQWEAILALIPRVTGSAILITSNTKDFGENGSLEKHLREDLQALNKPGCLTVCNGLDAFLKNHVEPELEKLDDIARAIGEGQYESLVTDDLISGMHSKIERAIQDAVREDDLKGLGSFARMRYSAPKLEWLDDDFKVVDADVFRVDEGELAISVGVAVDGTIVCEHEETGYGGPDEPPEHWIEEHEGDAQFIVGCGAVISEETGEVSDESVDYVEIHFGRNWERPDYGD